MRDLNKAIIIALFRNITIKLYDILDFIESKQPHEKIMEDKAKQEKESQIGQKKEKEAQTKRQKEVERLDKIYNSLDPLKQKGIKRKIEKRLPALERLKNRKKNWLN